MPQFVRFLVVGTLNTSFSYAIYAALLYTGLGYKLANFFAVVIGVLFSFKTQGHLVFDNPDNRLLVRFVGGWVLIYLCTIALIGWIMSLGFNAYLAGALALPFSVLLSYLLQKFFVFRRVIPARAGPT